MEIKNMQYWKRKATLPGLNYESENKLPNGLAKSSALQKNEKEEAKKAGMRVGKKAAEDYERASRKAKLERVKPKVKKPVRTKIERVARTGGKILSNIHKAF